MERHALWTDWKGSKRHVALVDPGKWYSGMRGTALCGVGGSVMQNTVGGFALREALTCSRCRAAVERLEATE